MVFAIKVLISMQVSLAMSELARRIEI